MTRCFSFRAGVAAAMLIVGCAPASSSNAGPATVALPSPQALNSLLSATLRPPRDLYALTARLKLHSTATIDPYVNHTPQDYPVGSTARFYVGKGSQESGFDLVPATLALKTAHAYYYVQQGVRVDMQALARSAATFEHHSYPTDHAVYGLEWDPGVDDDTHITIFNGHVPGVLGYFSGEDLVPRSINQYSNQRKMVFINLDDLRPGTSGYDEVLAHEFQHMIHFHLHPADEAWINEGDSVLAQVLNGYSDGGFAANKDSNPVTQLDAWDNVNFGPYYGGGYLWMLYLYEHYGGTRLTRAELADSTLSNMAVFDDVLAKLGYHQRADDVFADWVVANVLNDKTIMDGRYGYTHTAVRVVPSTTVSTSFSQYASVPQYSASYFDVNPTNGAAFTLRFAGRPSVPLLNTVAPPQGFWWSNRGDGIDTTLTTPPLNLRSVHQATLHYQVWYDLEKDFDYGYVEVSADGGKTWYAQPTVHTTNTNPNGANIGSGYTGSSCSASSTAQHCWLDERVDLSAYAGKSILVRFEQVTDDEYNGQGIAVAHLQVPEIGFDGDTAANGWQPAGWLRVGNTEVQNWIVQAIVYRSSKVDTIMRMPVGTDGRGSLAIPAGSSRVVITVSPAAPLTTDATSFSLTGA